MIRSKMMVGSKMKVIGETGAGMEAFSKGVVVTVLEDYGTSFRVKTHYGNVGILQKNDLEPIISRTFRDLTIGSKFWVNSIFGLEEIEIKSLKLDTHELVINDAFRIGKEDIDSNVCDSYHTQWDTAKAQRIEYLEHKIEEQKEWFNKLKKERNELAGNSK